MIDNKYNNKLTKIITILNNYLLDGKGKFFRRWFFSLSSATNPIIESDSKAKKIRSVVTESPVNNIIFVVIKF